MQLRVLFQLSLQCSSSSRNVKFFFFLVNFGKWFGLGFLFCFDFQYSQVLFYSFTVCITVDFEAFVVSGTTVAYGQLGCSAGSN